MDDEATDDYLREGSRRSRALRAQPHDLPAKYPSDFLASGLLPRGRKERAEQSVARSCLANAYNWVANSATRNRGEV
jgi:hypothetical protein